MLLLSVVLLAGCLVGRGAASADLLSCETSLGGSLGNDSAAVGTWFLVQCFTTPDARCSDSQCMHFDLTTPQERKQLSEIYSPRLSDVVWENLSLKVVTPCATNQPAAASAATPNFLEKTSPAMYRLITLPPVGSKPTAKMSRPRPVRLELVGGEFLVMLDCLDSDPVLMSRGKPAPAFRDNPVVAMILEHTDY